ncbi:unnamed protein product [Schistocephalus solidus]|uniref:Integrase catalytic domain-containing protein n=1 Tax=Schistocephalus solidus TaxID=70667 RepID=A0A183TTJ1_SCHSO|nr:unnamed protein product [Schistocephalus solidus]
MNTEILKGTRACLACQKAKIGRHYKAAVETFLAPDARFAHVHIDLLGPLLTFRGCKYLLPAMERLTGWPIATPLSNITADTVAHVFLEHWISHYCVPSSITTDRGQQLSVFTVNSKPRTRPMTTPLTGASICPWSCSVSAPPSNPTWSAPLLNLRIFGDFFEQGQSLVGMDPTGYVPQLPRVMSNLRAMPPRASAGKSYIDPTLLACSFVFVRVDGAHKPLKQPFDGLFRVVE